MLFWLPMSPNHDMCVVIVFSASDVICLLYAWLPLVVDAMHKVDNRHHKVD